MQICLPGPTEQALLYWHGDNDRSCPRKAVLFAIYLFIYLFFAFVNYKTQYDGRTPRNRKFV